ncbi:MAG: serine/threonine-protein kinase [Pirellulales bacterium]
MSHSTDRNLLVGILALQMDFISRDQLFAAMHAWILQKDRPLEQILLDDKALTGDTMALLQALVAKHLELHGNDAQQSLQSLSSIGDLRRELQSLTDPDLQATMTHVARPAGSVDATVDHQATRIDEICDQFVQAWREGKPPRIEDYLQQAPTSAHDELLEAILREEIQMRRAAGDFVRAEDYHPRFPQHRDIIARAFTAPKSNRRVSKVEYRWTSEHGDSRSVSRFRVIRPHAKGGLGEVFLARDTELNREVALKEIQSRYVDNPESRSRFLLEAEVTGGLEHPGVVPVYGLGQYADGRPFYAMRFIKGNSLKEAIEQFHRQYAGAKDLATGEVGVEFRKLLGRFIDVCEAIEYAHSRGVLHRDLKPGNIMLGKYGETLVVDWGLAKVVGRSEHHQAAGETTIAPESGSGSAPTQMGSAVGTPAYMSPEQAAGNVDELGPAADVYSLGATLYCLLTGQAPFAGDDARNVLQILQKVERGEFLRPRQLRPPIAAALEAICLKAMALRPAERYATPKALAEDIEKWLADEPVSVFREPALARLRRIMKRHQLLVASSAAGMIVAMLAMLAISTVVTSANEQLSTANASIAAKNQELEQSNRELVIAKDAETVQRQIAVEKEARARMNHYVASIRLAQNAWALGQVGEMSYALDEARGETSESDLRRFEWNYLKNLTQSELVTIGGFEGTVTGAAFSPDGRRIALGSHHPASVQLWSWSQNRFSIPDSGPVWCVAFSGDGKLIAAGRGDNYGGTTIGIWDVDTGKLRATLDGHEALVKCLVFDSTGSRIVSGSNDHRLKVWDLASGKERGSFDKHAGRVASVALSSDGVTVVSAGTDGLKLWSIETLQEIRPLKGHDGVAYGVAFSPDGTQFVSGGDDGQVRLWSTEDGREIAVLSAHPSSVHAVSWSLDGRHIATGAADSIIRILNPKTGRTECEFKGHKAARVRSVAFHADSRRLVSAGDDGTARIWDVVEGPYITTLRGHSDQVSAVALSPNGQLVASASQDNTVKIWDRPSGEVLVTNKAHSKEVYSVAFSPDGKQIVSRTIDGDIRVWEFASGKDVFSTRDSGDQPERVAFSHDGKRIGCHAWENDKLVIHTWDIQTGHLETVPVEEFHPFPHGNGGVVSQDNAVSLSRQPFSSQIIVVRTDLANTPILQLPADKSRYGGIAMSADERWVAVGNDDGTITLYDGRPESEAAERLAEREAVCAFRHHRDRVETREQLVSAIESDETISDEARQKALLWARTLPSAVRGG